ncbi:Histone H2B.7 [Citrus sinensis]|uniref:Histone H2A/H2B/H3 domain-containing protein n=1 Tax=Citrus clementina TaxID=85681 RepID=V4T393_CITCL|nr:hypothetical protein CICLE_v10023876mg [Citrus x clementina]KAH9724861.1 Histone H2B.7 [Citrus sinensis]
MEKKPKAGKKLPKKAASSDKEKKCAKKSIKTYKIYIFKVLKQEFARYKKKPTITSWEIQTVGRLVLLGELAKHTVSEGTKVVTKFTS